MYNLLNKINSNKFNIVLQNDVKEIAKLEFIVESLSSDWNLYGKVGFNINLVVEEVVSNIIIHGEMGSDLEKKVVLDFELINNNICIQIKDNCKEFNPLDKAEKRIEGELEDMSIGGLGILFIRKLSNNLKYKRVNNNNILSFEILNSE